MSSLRLEVATGVNAGRVFDAELGVVRIGRAPENELVLGDPLISSQHARIVSGVDGFVLQDLSSANGTWLYRAGRQYALGEAQPSLSLLAGDRLTFGGALGEGSEVRVDFTPDTDTLQVALVRPLSELAQPSATSSASDDRLRLLVQALRELVSHDGVSDVATGIADAALRLVPRATHATVVLRSATNGERDETALGFVPVVTRVLGPAGPQAPEGPVRVTRSVVRKVTSERAALLAADAPGETFSSESLLGASIRSTIGVPLWKDDQISKPR